MSQTNQSGPKSPSPSSSDTSTSATTDTSTNATNLAFQASVEASVNKQLQAFQEQMMEMFNQFASRYEQQTAQGINQTREEEARDFQKFNSAGMKLESHVQDVEHDTHQLEKEVGAFEEAYNKRVRFEDERFQQASNVMAQAQDKESDLQEQITALRDQMAELSSNQLATLANVPKPVFVTTDDIAIQIKRIFPQADLTNNDWNQPTNEFPPFMDFKILLC